MRLSIYIVVPPDLREIFKCIAPKIPRADNLFFWKDKAGKLHYGRGANLMDDPIPAAQFYMTTGQGDSGGPYWIDDKKGSDRRQTVIALVARGWPPSSSIRLWGKIVPCLKWASKLTNDVTKWIKFMDTSINM